MWNVLKQVLYHNIDSIIDSHKNERDIEREEMKGEISKKMAVLNKSTQKHGNEKWITFIQFLEESLRIIHNDPYLDIKKAKVFINSGNLMHMAVELDHTDYIKYFAAHDIPGNELNSDLNTPFHLAVLKKNRALKLRILGVLKDNHTSPFLSFSIDNSPLKLWLRQQDVDSSFELIKNNEFVNDFMDEMQNNEHADEYITQLLIEWFGLFHLSYDKCEKISHSIITLFGGNVLNFRRGANPILESWRNGKFNCIEFLWVYNLVEDWDKITDDLGKNVFHYAWEHNEVDVVKLIIKYIKRSNPEEIILYNLIFKQDHDGLIPRHYADPHRPIAKFLNYLEKKLLRKRISERQRFNIAQIPNNSEKKYLTLNDVDENMIHKKVNIRYWNDFKAKKMPAQFESRLRNHFEDLKLKKRGVSSNASRLKRADYFAALHPQMSLEFPNQHQYNQYRVNSFKTPKKSFEKLKKRMSSFNENKRRPINTLTIPKKGDIVSDSGSMSSVKSENSK
jgi:ankyrin repeat protein